MSLFDVSCIVNFMPCNLLISLIRRYNETILKTSTIERMEASQGLYWRMNWTKHCISTKPVLDRIDCIYKLSYEKLMSSIFYTLKMEAASTSFWAECCNDSVWWKQSVLDTFARKSIEYAFSDFNCCKCGSFRCYCVGSSENIIPCFLQNSV